MVCARSDLHELEFVETGLRVAEAHEADAARPDERCLGAPERRRAVEGQLDLPASGDELDEVDAADVEAVRGVERDLAEAAGELPREQPVALRLIHQEAAEVVRVAVAEDKADPLVRL